MKNGGCQRIIVPKKKGGCKVERLKLEEKGLNSEKWGVPKKNRGAKEKGVM